MLYPVSCLVFNQFMLLHESFKQHTLREHFFSNKNTSMKLGSHNRRLAQISWKDSTVDVFVLGTFGVTFCPAPTCRHTFSERHSNTASPPKLSRGSGTPIKNGGITALASHLLPAMAARRNTPHIVHFHCAAVTMALHAGCHFQRYSGSQQPESCHECRKASVSSPFLRGVKLSDQAC